ncbi:MAG: flippase-like domain-containing protein [Desulfobulbaceae bacterium]|nr:flippase-like domain-containing protein [Desulfobulbaceae bacterium]
MTIDRFGKKSRSLYYIFLSLLVSCSVFVYLFSRITFDEITSAVVRVPLNTINLFVFFSLVMSLCRAWRYQLLLQTANINLRFTALFLVTLVRNLFSDLLPARIGTLVYIYIVNKRLNVPLSSATSSFAICFLFDIIAVSLLGVFTSLCYFSDSQTFFLVTGAGLFLLLCTFLVLYFLPWFLVECGKLIGRSRFLRGPRRDNLKKSIDEIGAEVNMTKQSGVYGKVFALSLLLRFFKYVSLYILFIGLISGLGESVKMFPLFKVVTGMIAAELSASLPISGIAGFGAYEGTWAFVFQLLGYSEKLSVVTSVSHHLITQVYGYGLGSLAVLALLLPAMATPGRYQDSKSGKEKVLSFFFVRLSILIVTVSAIMIWFFPEISFARDKSTDERRFKENGKPGAVLSLSEIPQELKGSIVFQRSDGIYVQVVGESKGKRIIEGGSYPRWSNDGKQIVFLKGNKVMIARFDGKRVKEVAVSKKPQAVCFYPDGEHILYIDGKSIMIANTRKFHVVKFLEGYNFKELDISDDGKKVAATVKNITGYSVKLFDLENSKVRTVARGCSATLSPDGRLVTSNESGHKTLRIFDSGSLKLTGRIHAPKHDLFDNQKWSNDSDWLVSTSEKKGNNIFIHKVSSDTAYQITVDGDCDRGDLFIDR